MELTNLKNFRNKSEILAETSANTSDSGLLEDAEMLESHTACNDMASSSSQNSEQAHNRSSGALNQKPLLAINLSATYLFENPTLKQFLKQACSYSDIVFGNSEEYQLAVDNGFDFENKLVVITNGADDVRYFYNDFKLGRLGNCMKFLYSCGFSKCSYNFPAQPLFSLTL